jgi:alkanesulfonate monooxygenase SsuD/methylene tetrahydromethanopterin reductase-like flavin-dependent oxidoreductase (luciferase family)
MQLSLLRGSRAIDFSLAVQNNRLGASAEGMDTSGEVALRFGWRTLWVADHLLVSSAGGPKADEWYAQYNVLEHEWILEALLSLMYIGARYEKVLLGLGVIVPAIAPLLAKEIATLDTLSGGRVIAGVGVGDEEDFGEYQNLGKADRFRRRGAHLNETIALWRHLWSGRTDPFLGEFHQLNDFTFQPPPPQGASLPIWSSGRSDRALARVGAITDGYLGSRWSPDLFEKNWPPVLERARQNGRPRPHLAMRVRIRIDEEPDQIFSLCGSAAAVVNGLLKYEAAGADEVVAVFDAVYPEDIVRDTERFQREVVEPYREESARRAADRSARADAPAV